MINAQVTADKRYLVVTDENGKIWVSEFRYDPNDKDALTDSQALRNFNCTTNAGDEYSVKFTNNRPRHTKRVVSWEWIY